MKMDIFNYKNGYPKNMLFFSSGRQIGLDPVKPADVELTFDDTITQAKGAYKPDVCVIAALDRIMDNLINR